MVKQYSENGAQLSHLQEILPLAAAVLLASLGVSIATVALPTLSQVFSVSMTGVQWVILAYLLSVTATVAIVGRMGDLFGHRRMLLAGLAIFSAASALCAIAPSLGFLVVARIVQGLGGAVLMTQPMSIARETVPTEKTGAAMGLLGSMSAIGTALGPSLGGALIAWQGWRVSFILLALIGPVVLFLAWRNIPGLQPKSARKHVRPDLLGAIVLAVSLGVYALSTTGTRIIPWANASFLLLVAAAGAILFVVIESRTAAPIVQVAVLRNRTVALPLLANLLVTTGMMATLVVGPFYLSFVLNLNEAQTGLVMAVGPMVAAATGIPAGRLADRFGTARIVMLGLVESLIGFLCLAFLPGLLGVPGYVLSLAILTPGFQLFLAANSTSMMVAAREDQRGMTSGLLGLSRNLGFMTGASAMGAVFAVAAGTQNVASAAPAVVSVGFSATFVLAAGLILIAGLVSFLGGRDGSVPVAP